MGELSAEAEYRSARERITELTTDRGRSELEAWAGHFVRLFGKKIEKETDPEPYLPLLSVFESRSAPLIEFADPH